MGECMNIRNDTSDCQWVEVEEATEIEKGEGINNIMILFEVALRLWRAEHQLLISLACFVENCCAIWFVLRWRRCSTIRCDDAEIWGFVDVMVGLSLHGRRQNTEANLGKHTSLAGRMSMKRQQGRSASIKLKREGSSPNFCVFRCIACILEGGPAQY